jgi:uridine phosphorylase
MARLAEFFETPLRNAVSAIALVRCCTVVHHIDVVILASGQKTETDRARHWTLMNNTNWSAEQVPLLHHPIGEETAFTPHALIEAVKRARRLPDTAVPAVCVLEFDGDLTDWLVAGHVARPWPTWACFHTPMFAIDVDGETCGIVPRTIGGPYAVLVAEQLAASGARVIVGLTSAGRVRPDLPIPSVVVATSAVRDEGTSYHYLPPQPTIDAPCAVVDCLYEELSRLGLPVTRGRVWTTDAPYRETRRQLEHHAGNDVLAVEMQAASLFAFSAARGTPAAVVAHVSNAVDHTGEPFDRGSDVEGGQLLNAICRGASRFLRVGSFPVSPP